MKLFEKRIRFGLLVVLTAFFLFSCDSLINKVTGNPDDLPFISNVTPDNEAPLTAGSVVEFTFECDELDVVRVSYQNDEEEIEYEYIEKENGAFKKKLWIPVQATRVQLYVVKSGENIYGPTNGEYYNRRTYKVTGTKPFGAYTTPDSYAKANTYRTDKPEAFIEDIAADANLEAKRKSDPLAYVQDICGKIKAEAGTDDFKKAKMIHDLLALIIPYDMEGVKKEPMPPQDYWTVLKTGKGVCQGYALTYKKFCEIIGIECDYVFGWNRNDTHAWNIVKLDGKCYLLDTTWDAGRAVDGAFNKNYTTEYFLVNPTIFAFSHFPKYSKHQLLATPFGGEGKKTINDSKAVFQKLPDATPLYFDLIDDPDNNAIAKLNDTAKATNGLYSFSYKLKDGIGDVKFSVRAFKGDTDANKIIKYDSTTKENEALFSFPDAGTYTARVIMLEGASTTGTVVASFKIESDKAADGAYATTYTPVIAINPTTSSLNRGESYDFQVLLSRDADEVFAGFYYTDTDGSKKGYYGKTSLTTSDNRLFTGSITIPSTVASDKDVTYMYFFTQKKDDTGNLVYRINDKDEEGNYIQGILDASGNMISKDKDGKDVVYSKDEKTISPVVLSIAIYNVK